MMTALVVVAKAKPNARVLITRDALTSPGSGVGCSRREARAADAAALRPAAAVGQRRGDRAGRLHVARTQTRFMALMNHRGARQLGLPCTHFTTVSGIVDQGNHSCAPTWR